MRPVGPGARPRRLAGAFTLIELLVTIAIVSILVALTIGVVGAMTRGTAESIGTNAATLGVSTARGFATQRQPGRFTGAAALFMPSGEIRIVVNDSTARADSTSGPLLEQIESVGAMPITGAVVLSKRLSGFRDAGVDYLTVPSGTGVAGVRRSLSASASDPPQLVAPPFAVWFSPAGTLVVGDEDHHFVYYNNRANFDAGTGPGTAYDVTADRGSVSGTYNPWEYDPTQPEFDPDVALQQEIDSDGTGFATPFEKIETVIGVITYDKDDFRAAVEDGDVPDWEDDSPGDNEDRWEWFMGIGGQPARGKMTLFSWQTGTPTRVFGE